MRLGYDGPIALSMFADKTGHDVRSTSDTWGDFVNMLAALGQYPKKDACPLVKLATFGNIRSNAGSLRHDANLQTVWGLECDRQIAERKKVLG